MRGLIYKDVSVFFKSIDKKLMIIAGAAIMLLMFQTGAYAGFLVSVMLAMTIGMQNVMSFAIDEKAGWKKYQLAMPVSSLRVVASKYVSVLYTVMISMVGSVAFNALGSVISGSFDLMIWGLSVAAAIMLPMLWTGICLPFTYWFGYHSGQTMGLISVIPMFYFIKYFEDGAGISVMVTTGVDYVAAAFIVVLIIFVFSMAVSVIGYERKK